MSTSMPRPAIVIRPAGALDAYGNERELPDLSTGTVVALTASTLVGSAVTGLVIGGLAALIVNAIKKP